MDASVILLAATALATHGHPDRPPHPRQSTSVAAQGTATVRIVTPALIGPGFAAPLPGMTLHDSSVESPNGQRTPLKLYEFE